MAGDIAALGFEIDSSQARTAAKDLDKLNAAAVKVERGAKSLKAASRDLLRDESGRFMTAAKAADTYGSEIDALRMKYNPIYAASKQFEAQTAELNRALALGAISVSQYDAALATLQGGMVRGGAAATGFGKQMSNANMHTANVFAQLNDIGVMMASGQNPLILAMQQGTQLNQTWGMMGNSIKQVGASLAGAFASMLNPMSLLTIGVIAGGAALVQWGMSALGASEDTKTFDSAIGDVSSSISELNNQGKLLSEEGLQGIIDKYGEVNAGLIEFINLQTQAMKREAIDNVATAMASLSDEQDTFFASGDWNGLANLFNINAIAANNMSLSLRDARSATNFEDQLAALTSLRTQIVNATGGIDNMTSAQFKFFLKVQESEGKVKELVNSAPKAGWMSPAIRETNLLIGRLIAARDAASQIKIGGAAGATGQTPVIPAPHTQTGGVGTIDLSSAFTGSGSGSTGSSSSGGGTDPYADNLTRLIESLRSEQEVADAWYNENLTILNDRRAMEILGDQGHKEAMLDLEREYQEKLSNIRSSAGNQQLTDTANLFGELAGIAEAGGKKSAKAVATFQAIEGTINAYGAATKALNTPGLSLAGRFAAYASVLGAGLKGVAAIKAAGGSAGGSSGGASAVTSATTATKAEPDRVTRVELQGEDWIVSLAETMMTQIYDASRNGRVIISRA